MKKLTNSIPFALSAFSGRWSSPGDQQPGPEPQLCQGPWVTSGTSDHPSEPQCPIHKAKGMLSTSVGGETGRTQVCGMGPDEGGPSCHEWSWPPSPPAFLGRSR